MLKVTPNIREDNQSVPKFILCRMKVLMI